MKSLKVLEQGIQIYCGIMFPYSDDGEYPSLLECYPCRMANSYGRSRSVLLPSSGLAV